MSEFDQDICIGLLQGPQAEYVPVATVTSLYGCDDCKFVHIVESGQ